MATVEFNKETEKINVVFQSKIGPGILNDFPDNAFTIILLDKCDSGNCVTGLNKYSLKSKQLFIHLPKRVYKWDFSSDTVGRRLIVDDSLLETFAPELKYTFSIYSKYEMVYPNDETYQKFSDEFDAIRKELHSKFMFSELINARVRLLALIINLWVEHVYGSSGITTGGTNLAFKFHLLVDKYYKTQKSVAFYAKELSITPNYLGVICREQYRKSPLKFIKERVLLEAKKLLHSSDKTIKEISFELGFQNLSHFSYFFRTEMGMTPKSYRQVMDS